MFDTPPLTEIGVAAVAAAALVAAAMADRRVGRDLLLGLSTVLTIALVVLGLAPIGVVAGAALVWAAVAWPKPELTQPARQAMIALGLAVVLGLMVRDLTIELGSAALVSALLVAPLAWHTYRTSGPAMATTLFAATAGGIYINVPDTEQVAVVATGLSVVAVALWLVPALRKARTPFAAAALILVLLIAAGAVGARGRPTAFVGVLGALGVVLAEPIAGIVRRETRAHPAILVAIHLAAVIVASRVPGPGDSYGEALTVSGATIAGAFLALVALPRRRAAPHPLQAPTRR